MVQSYPLQMMEILEWPFNKIAIDLVTEYETSTSGNKHILTIINHLKGWLEAFPILDKSAYTIVSTFINQYLQFICALDHILLDNGTWNRKSPHGLRSMEQLSIDCIFIAPYHPQSTGKLEVFHKYLKLTLKKLSKLGQVHQSSSC